MIVTPRPREQTRGRDPDEEGYVERDGVRVFYEVYGDAPTTFLLFPTSPISHSRMWKAQIPYLSRHFRVITFDPRGNGRSDRPDTAEAYSYWEFVEDGRAILEATRTETALLAGICDGGGWALMLAATQPATALGVAAIAPCVPRLTPSHPNYRRYPSLEPLDTDEGWAKCNVHYWRRDYRGFLEFFFSEQIPESHSTKHIEDCVQWGLDGSAEALVLSDEEAPLPFASQEEARALCRRVRCPVLVIHGELDGCQPRERAVAVAELTGGTLVALEGAGHLPQARHPVKVNELLREFAASVVPPKPKVKTWTRAPGGVAGALRLLADRAWGTPSATSRSPASWCKLHPDLEVDLLALNRYRAGRRMGYATSDPDAITAEMGRPVDYRPVKTDGPARAANLIAQFARGVEARLRTRHLSPIRDAPGEVIKAHSVMTSPPDLTGGEVARSFRWSFRQAPNHITGPH
jgi:pimeloyl-ACP methyl ester carboxylesterase